MSNIEWTDETWNPVTGCTKVSAGCKNCYAEKMAKRLKAMGQPRYKDGFKLTLQKDLIHRPSTWKKPRMVFVNSMSDLFHEDVPSWFLGSVFGEMIYCKRHTFQVLTKRSKRLLEMMPFAWASNIWIGVSVENQKTKHRIDDLRNCGAKVKFLSLEPLLEDLGDLNLDGIDWVIVGGESQSGARPMQADWVRNIRDQCIAQNVPFFFKQWGGVRKKKGDNVLDGKRWEQYPEKNKN